MKESAVNNYLKYGNVAPLVGAWIESASLIVPPCVYTVAPLVGAWIERYIYYSFLYAKTVAPLVGAWIESNS